MVQQGTVRPAAAPKQAVGPGQPGVLGQPVATGQPGSAMQLRPYTPYRPPASLHPGEFSYPRPGFNMSQVKFTKHGTVYGAISMSHGL